MTPDILNSLTPSAQEAFAPPPKKTAPLARTLGLKAKEVRGRIGNETGLSTVSDTRQRIAEEMSPVLRRHIDDARASWRNLSATLAFKKVAVRDRQRTERQSLNQMQQQRVDMEAKARAGRLPKGFKGIWSRIMGRYNQLKRESAQDAQVCQQRDGAERGALVFHHLGERRKLQAQIRTHRSQQAELLLKLRDDRRVYERLRTEPQKERRRKD